MTLRPQKKNLNADSIDKTLGPEYINGLYATGNRSVEAILPGRGGNETDHPVNRVDEFWMAPDLGMVVKTFLDDGSGFTERSELRTSIGQSRNPRYSFRRQACRSARRRRVIRCGVSRTAGRSSAVNSPLLPRPLPSYPPQSGVAILEPAGGSI